MPGTYIICAEIDADDTVAVGLYPRDWFNCGINDNSERYSSADAGLLSARVAYKGPDMAGTGCRVWAKRVAA